MSQYLICFSPTGKTGECAEAVAKAWNDSWVLVDLSDRECAFEQIVFTQDDFVLVAVPSYGGRVPTVAGDRMARLKGNGAKAALLCVYGNRAYEDTLAEMKDIMWAAGFRCIAAIAAVAEHSIVRAFAANRPDGEDCATLLEYGKQIAELLKTQEGSETVAVVNVPGNHPYKEKGASGLKPGTSEKCVACGLCAAKCPTGAITVEGKAITDEAECISCMRCVSVCPMKARSVNPELIAGVTERLRPVCETRKANELFLNKG